MRVPFCFAGNLESAVWRLHDTRDTPRTRKHFGVSFFEGNPFCLVFTSGTKPRRHVGRHLDDRRAIHDRRRSWSTPWRETPQRSPQLRHPVFQHLGVRRRLPDFWVGGYRPANPGTSTAKPRFTGVINLISLGFEGCKHQPGKTVMNEIHFAPL